MPLKEVRAKILVHRFGGTLFAMIHPSALLRMKGHHGNFKEEYEVFIQNLHFARQYLESEEDQQKAA